MDLAHGLLILLTLAAAALPIRALYRRRTGASLSRIQRDLRTRAVDPLARLGEGPVQVRGEAQPISTVRGPFSGDQVIAYRLLVEQQDQSTYWPLFEESVAVDFELVDQPTGARALIKAESALLILTHRTCWGPGVAELPESVRAGLAAHSQYIPTKEVAAKIRWCEYQLRSGDEILVQGASTLVPSASSRFLSGSAPYRAAPLMPVIQKDAHHPLVLICQQAETLLKESLVMDGEIEQIIPRALSKG